MIMISTEKNMHSINQKFDKYRRLT